MEWEGGGPVCLRPLCTGNLPKGDRTFRSLSAHVSVLAAVSEDSSVVLQPLMAWLRAPNTGWGASRQHSGGKTIPERGQWMEGGTLMADQAPKLKRQLMQLSPDPKP